MTRNLDLSTESKWRLMHSVSIPPTVVATIGSKTHYAKITPIRPSIILDKAVLGIGVNTTVPAGKQWIYAGSLSRFTNSFLGEIYIEDRKPLFLGRFNLVITDNLSNNYQVQINIPSWFISCNLSIYQYEGDERTTTEQQINDIKATGISIS